MRIAIAMLMVVVVAVALHFREAGGGDVVPTGAVHGDLLITHDLNKVPTSGEDEIINGVPFREWLESIGLEGHYRIVGPKQKFAADSPFATLIQQPRKSDDWMYAGDYSGPLPANAAEAKATIQRHMR